MSSSFLLHVAKTIPRSSIKHSLLSQFYAAAANSPRAFSSTSQVNNASGLTIWGGEAIAQSIRNSPSRSLVVALQPIRPFSSTSAAASKAANKSILRAQDNKNDGSGSDQPPSSGDSGSHGNSAANGGDGKNNGGGDDGSPVHNIQKALNVIDNQLQKPSVPEVYPQVLALPITRRPLFPGFYKAVVIKDPQVTAAIKELLKRGQPYVGAFLLKDEELDVDTITDLNQIHRVGVFAQITSVFPASANAKDGTKEDPGLTAVLYPHRRIRIQELLPIGQPNKNIDKAKDDSTGSDTVVTAAVVKDEGPLVEPTKTTKSETPKSDNPKSDKKSKKSAKEATMKDQAPESDPNKKSDFVQDAAPSTEQQTQYATSFLVNDYAVSLANVENMEDYPYSKKDQVIRAVTSEIVSVFKDIASLNPLFRDQIASFSMSQSAGNVFEEPAKLADFAAAVSAGEPAELQDVLECLSVEERLQKALLVLKKELMNAQLQNKISKEVESKIAKRQREYYLMEQLKGIKKELGLESDGKDKLVEGFKEKASKLAMPNGVKKVFDEEITKLAHLEPAASEFNVTRNYLDWLTQIPWGQRSQENYNIKHAVTVLDEDHYGLQDVKDRILEFIAVGKLRGTVEGKILCLVGPPGVGKTSIGKSIARALDRQFYRFSVGGLSDVAEIKGHRRTYVGAMPGKVIQALKKVQTENPLVLIDEVDKIGKGHQGDPSSALLELLDPEQNSSFLDHYMDVPVDLSKVLFVCTANVLDTIPGPLLDRMEVIQLSGYVADEKVAIAEKYLSPTAKTAAGLEHVNVNLTKDAIESLIKNYCRESGVRNLKKQIDKVYRKAALKIVKDIGEDHFQQQPGDSAKTLSVADGAMNVHEKAGEERLDPSRKESHEEGEEITTKERHPIKIPDSVHVDITSESLKDYVGPPVFHSDRLYDRTPPGVVMGLAWTSLGGSSLYIESVLESPLTPKSVPTLSKTGQLGDVMKESTTIAYTFAKSLLANRFPKNAFFEKAQVHLHCPAGAVPKDGPSAGVTMATSLISLALNRPINPNIAMTGELTVTGKVLQIGGLKEKTIAAKRSNVNTILYPKDNQSDWDDLPEHIKEGMTGVPVDHYDEVFNICFEGIDPQEAESVWADKLKEDENTKVSV
ncbi:ATP-dependent Lon protease pim1 [Umbelopsis nana]